MRPLALLAALVLALAAGCGAEGTTSGGAPASSTPVSTEGPTGSTEEPTVSEPDVQADPSPPPFVLVSGSGKHTAVQLSFCVDDLTAGVGVCTATDAPGDPEELIVLRPGETVEVVLAGADVAEGTIGARQVGCPDQVASVPLTGPITLWEVELPPGSYAIDLSATFEAGSTTGDTSATIGVLVDAAAPRGVIPAPAQFDPCED